jgi:hypothetical protein
MPDGTIIATTRSGSFYVMAIRGSGVEWWRVPGDRAVASATTGWSGAIPRVVPGERMYLGSLFTTPVVSVGYLPRKRASSTTAR